MAEQEVQTAVAIELRGRALARPGDLRPFPQGLHGHAVDVHSGQVPKRPRIGDPPGYGARERGDDELADLVHEPVVVVARTIPLEESELGIVARSRLSGPERAGDLENGSAPGREHSLHRVLGGALEPAGAFVGTDRGKAGDGRVHGAAGGKDRGLHLQHPAFGEEVPDPCDHPGAPLPSSTVTPGAPGRPVRRQPVRHRSTP